MERHLHAVGRIEGSSLLVLLGIAMPLKYWAGQPEAVLVAGSVHGGLWLLYMALLARVWSGLKWPLAVVFLGGIASVLPLGPWVFEAWTRRRRVSAEA